MNQSHESLQKWLSSYFVMNSGKKRKREEKAKNVSFDSLKRIFKTASATEMKMHMEFIVQTLRKHLLPKKKQILAEMIRKIVWLADALFKRSAVFRNVIISHLSQFYEELLGSVYNEAKVRDSAALIAYLSREKNPSVGSVLKDAIQLIQSWKDSHGREYPVLCVGYSVIESKGLVSCARSIKSDTEAEKAIRLQKAQYKQLRLEVKDIGREIELVLQQMTNLFDILLPNFTDTQESVLVPDSASPHSSEEEDNILWEDVGSESREYDSNSIVQEYGLGSTAYHLEICIPTRRILDPSPENQILFKTLYECVLQIRKRFFPIITHWKSVCASVPPDTARDTLLKIEYFHNRLKECIAKYEELTDMP